MEVKSTIKTEVESFELGDVISFKLKDGEKVQAKAVKQTDEDIRKYMSWYKNKIFKEGEL